MKKRKIKGLTPTIRSFKLEILNSRTVLFNGKMMR